MYYVPVPYIYTFISISEVSTLVRAVGFHQQMFLANNNGVCCSGSSLNDSSH